MNKDLLLEALQLHIRATRLLATALGIPDPLEVVAEITSVEEEAGMQPQDPGSTELKEITLKDIQTAASSLVKAGKRDALKAILTRFGVANLSALQEDDYPQFHAQLLAA